MLCCRPWVVRRHFKLCLDLVREGVLEKYNVEMIGADREAIDKAEDREQFRQAMHKIGLDMPRSAIAHSLEEAFQVQAQLGISDYYSPFLYHGRQWWWYCL